jgi:hypothetical protein
MRKKSFPCRARPRYQTKSSDASWTWASKHMARFKRDIGRPYLKPRSVRAFYLGFGPILGLIFFARLRHVKTLMGYLVDRFWLGKAQEKPPRPVELGWK